MDFNRLQEFTLIARHKSITKAAKELSVSPAALGARLRAFEASLGLTLFVREKAGLSLTQAGLRLYHSALEISSDFAALKETIQRLPDEDYRHIRIAVSGTGLPLYLGPYLDQVNRRNPDLTLELFDDTRFGIADGLLSGQVDLYFSAAANQFRPEGIVRNSFVPSQQYVVLPAEHPLASRITLSFSDLDGEQFILYPKSGGDSSLRDFQLQNLEASGIRYRLYENGSSPLFGLLLVPIGKGLYLSPAPVWNLPPNSVCIPLERVPIPASLSVFYSRTLCRPEAQRFVREFLSYTKSEKEDAGHDHRKTL